MGKALEETIGYRFRDPALFAEALTHKSYSNEPVGKSLPHNERLEFLGDAVLDLAVSEMMFQTFPTLSEGELTRIRAEVVSEASLAARARTLDLGPFLRLGRGETQSGGREKDSLLADALEALLGAVFCDGGFEPARQVVDRLFADTIRDAVARKAGVDFKTRLQEVLQARFGAPPVYALVKTEGPPHQRSYSVEVRFAEETIGCGQGRTKKGAEQEAARQALNRLGS